MISLVAGRPGDGKSLFAAMLAAELSRAKQQVVFSNLEDSTAHVIRPRLEACHADLKRIHLWREGHGHGLPRIPQDLDELEALIKRTKASAFIMDPVSAHITASIYNDQEVRTALTPLSEMADRTGAAIIGIHHTIKSGRGITHPLQVVGGSGGGLGGAARAVYIFGVDPDDADQRVLAPAKYNLGPWPDSVLFEMDEFEYVHGKGEDARLISAGKLVFISDQAKIRALKLIESGLVTKVGRDSIDKRAMAADWLTGYLAMGPRPANDVFEDALQYAHSRKLTRRAGEDIGIQRKRVGFGAGGKWWWRLPGDHPALLPTVSNDLQGGNGDGWK